MSLPGNTPFNDVFLAEGTTSVAASPIAAVIVSPVAGFLRKVFAAAGGTTSGTITVAVTINAVATDVASSLLTIAAGSNARNNPGVDIPKIGASSVPIAEGDVITFTPSGGTGASIPGAFTAVIRKT